MKSFFIFGAPILTAALMIGYGVVELQLLKSAANKAKEKKNQEGDQWKSSADFPPAPYYGREGYAESMSLHINDRR